MTTSLCRLPALAGATLATILTASAAQAGGDAARGERVFQKCFACHSVKPDETGPPGPNLAGVVGRPAASLPDFEYSPAMREKADAGLVWSVTALDRYLADPEAMIAGTEMAVNGLPDARERADVIAYLKAAAHAP